MDENSDYRSSKDLDRGAAEAGLAWQAAQFPQVAVSFGPGHAGFISVLDAWQPAGAWVDELLEYQTRFAHGMDDRTKGAHLISYYSHHLGVAAGALYLRSSMVPDLGPDGLAIRFEPYGRKAIHALAAGFSPDIRRLHFHFSRCRRGGEGASMFHDAFVESLTPVIETLQARTGLSPVAQWRLAADGLAGAFLDIGMASGEEAQSMEAALAIVGQEGSPLFSTGLRFERIEVLRLGIPAARFFRLRSGCCLYYRTMGGDFCDVCVLLDEKTQKSRLRAHLERADG